MKYVGVRLKIDPLFIEDKNLQFEIPWRYTLKSFLAFILAMCLALSVSAVSETGNETTDESTLASTIADQIYAAAAREETAVTPRLQSLETDSRHLTGLEHRLKSTESIARKLLLNAHDMEISLEEAVQTIHDALRYTFIIDIDRYTDGVDEILKALVSLGYGVKRLKNTWGNDGYKGINTNLTTPDGYVFEVQFHTQDSFDAKEVKTHDLYEIVRSEESTEAEKLEANAKQRAIFNAVPVPDGAVDYEWHDPTQPVD